MPPYLLLLTVTGEHYLDCCQGLIVLFLYIVHISYHYKNDYFTVY
jgi:hypothetical protein